MNFVANISLMYGPTVTGKGSTNEEAIQHCLQMVREHVAVNVKVAEDIVVPEEVAKRMPKEIPDGFSMVIFVRCSHNSGSAYDWRFVAVPTGSIITCRGLIEEGGKDIQKAIEGIVFLDSNSDYRFKLSKGGLEFDENGQTKPIRGVAYNY